MKQTDQQSIAHASSHDVRVTSINQSINLLAQIKIHKIDSNNNNCDIVLNRQKGWMSTYRCPLLQLRTI